MRLAAGMRAGSRLPVQIDKQMCMQGGQIDKQMCMQGGR